MLHRLAEVQGGSRGHVLFYVSGRQSLSLHAYIPSFLARNRLIAALADVTVVVEAGARSGALNTAHHAAQLGRPVFAVPGAFASSASVGCHRLIAQGRAQIVVHPADPVAAARPDVTDGRAGAADTPLLSGREDPEVLRVLDALGRRALPESEIARRSGMSVADVTDALALAQLQGLVVVGNGGWARA
ncbi:DNA-processing protein DprA [Curtobacterium sp. YC1]|uniref:DNA-processing protein DprA n=1 Tax=Curtobacterium sp. YC1 TaxID=2795488 RepID=UPI002FCD7E6F